MGLKKLTELRELMSCHPKCLDAYIVPTTDAHNSDYISKADARREWLTGYTGFVGTAVVTAHKALVWTDENYYTRFEWEVDLKIWTLMKRSLPETPTIENWLASNLKPGSVVGADPYTITKEQWTPLQTALSKARMKLIAVDKNLVDKARYKLNDPPPQRAENDITYLPLQYTGKPSGQKVKELREKMAEKKASALVITSLDEVAYTLNLRGTDIINNPIFFSYLLITPKSVILFWKDGCIPDNIVKCVAEEGVKIEGKPYAQTTEVLLKMAIDLSNDGDGQHSIWLSITASEAIHRAVSGEGVLKRPLTLISEVSPVALSKLIKNDVELEGFRRCHVRDGIAVVRFYRWLHDQIDGGITVTEIQAARKLENFRRKEKDFMCASFEPIGSAGENSGNIDYKPSDSICRKIGANDIFLLDSGCQYRDGTTDITRTRHMGEPTEFQKDTSTRVLKGQIGISTAIFPVGVKGNCLDTISRKYLWDVGLDFPTGTGHGVGHFLIVKEGPTGIYPVEYPQHPGLQSGQVLSNEPGYYKVGDFGIRHEDLVETVLITKNSKHPRASKLVGDFCGHGVLGFNVLSLCPQQKKLIKTELLDQFEGNCLDTISRKYLWDVGLDFPTGTGHGVGHFLIVKEGPTGIYPVEYPQHPGLQSGQVLSNEPGYYKVGDFGIRHEDLVKTVLITKNSKHPRASKLVGDFCGHGVLGFNVLSLCPQQKKLIKTELLDQFELNFLNSYHQRVLNTLGPILKERGLEKDLEWLDKECAPIKC